MSGSLLVKSAHMAGTGCFRHRSIVLLLAVLVGCSPHAKDSNGLMGTQSTGGGNPSVSTPDQVNAAIDKALTLGAETNPQKNIYVQFWKAKGQNSKSNFVTHPAHVFPQFNSSDESIRFNAPFYLALKQNKIVRLQEGDCRHPPEELTASASVSEHTFNATICFSVGDLTRIPPSSLLQEVTALLLHEITHMGGAEEPEARIWQNEFLRYFGERFGNILTDTDKDQTALMLSKAYALLNRAQSFAKKDLADRHILPDIMAAIETIASLPDANDELALSLKINPPHPELISNYVSAVQETVGTLRPKIETNDPKPALASDRIKIDLMVQAQDLDIRSTLDELRDDLDRINEAFVAFTQD